MQNKFNEHAKTHNSSATIVDGSFAYTPYDTIWPRVFLATNAKANGNGHNYACKLYRSLVALGLNPINVDIAMRETVIEDVIGLLRACPLLVSLLVPEKENKLHHEKLFAPSDWILFEESYIRGLGRKVYRMRDKSVRQPRYAPGTREYNFDNDQSFDKQLQGLAKAIHRHMTTFDWRKNLEASSKAVWNLDEALLQRDLESEFCG